MTNHNFSFIGGEILSKIGAAWFVSYAYYNRIDKEHTNWNLISTAESRKSKYITGTPYHKDWLQEILVMNDEKLNTNKIELEAQQVKNMAKEILNNWE